MGDRDKVLGRNRPGDPPQRRPLPRTGAHNVRGGCEVRFSELLAPGMDTLVVYSVMVPRSSGDTRPVVSVGETARLPLAETPARPAPRSSTRWMAPRRTSPAG
jgi:hypothetical protein